MDKIDSRTLPVDALNERRRRAVKMRLDGTSLTAKIIEVGEHHVIAEVTGTLTASCAVSSGAVIERVDDVQLTTEHCRSPKVDPRLGIAQRG